MLENRIKSCVIAAGGKGTRLSGINLDQPKALTEVQDKPIIFDQIDKFISYGCISFHILLGYKAAAIINAIKTRYKSHAINFKFHVENEPLGSGGSLLYFLHSLPEIFFYTYCDIYFNIDLGKLEEFHYGNNAKFTLVCHPNNHPHDSDLILKNNYDELIGLKAHPHKSNDFPGNLVNAAFYIIEKAALQKIAFEGFEDFAQSVIPRALFEVKIHTYHTHELLKDMGTPHRLFELEKILKVRDSLKLEKVIFIDRDGTLNEIREGEYITHADELTLLPAVGISLAQIRQMGYLIVLISNQPVVARGEVSFSELDKIHARLDWLLAVDDAYLDYKYVCPHHPDMGFEGEILELKGDCECRKPKDGLLRQAAKKINFNREKSWMVGDTYSDVGAGNSFGVNTCLISGNFDPNATFCVDGIASFVTLLKKFEQNAFDR